MMSAGEVRIQLEDQLEFVLRRREVEIPIVSELGEDVVCFGQVWIKLHRFKSGFLCLQKCFFPVGSRVAGKNSVSFSQTGVGRSVIWIARDHLLKEIDGTWQIIAAAQSEAVSSFHEK